MNTLLFKNSILLLGEWPVRTEPYSRKRVLLLLIFFLNASLIANAHCPNKKASVALNQKEYRISWNESNIERDAQLLLTPGALHTLGISNLNGESFKAKLLKILPNGSKKELIPSYLEKGKVLFKVGPFTAPSEFLYENGVVYRKGYRLELTITSHNGTITLYNWCQPLANKKNERLVPGKKERFVFTSGWGTKRFPQVEESLIMRPTISMRLHERILSHTDSLEIIIQSRLGKQLRCKLKITDDKGSHFYDKEGILTDNDLSLVIDLKNWKEGKYIVSLLPFIKGRYWEEGPVLEYNHVNPDLNRVMISPFADWSLEKDGTRTSITLGNMGKTLKQFAKEGYKDGCCHIDDKGNLRSTGQEQNASPIRLHLGIKGYYALFVEPIKECMVQLGDKGLIRPVKESLVKTGRGTFVLAKDLTDNTLNLYPYPHDGFGIKAIYLVPVTKTSVEEFYKKVELSDIPVVGVNDWKVYFKPHSRVAEDQIKTILVAQKEIGLEKIAWSIGRSTIEYKSKLKNVTVYPSPPPLSDSKARNDQIRERWNKLVNEDYYTKRMMIEKTDVLEKALKTASEYKLDMYAWLAMNRHYHGDPNRDVRWSLNSSLFYRKHPEWHQMTKNGDSVPGNGRMSYFFDEVQKERLDILLEVAAKNPNGLLIGNCRQVPMLAYNPIMAHEYKQRYGIDPTQIDGTDSVKYTQWIQWRANFFTDFLRKLKKGLKEIEQQTGKKIPVAIRVPSAGRYWNLAQGLDIEKWMQENLVDRIQLDPLEDRNGRGSHNVLPYLELGKKYGVEIYGGVGSSWFINGGKGFVPGLMRLRGLQQTGVDGIEIYETELMARASQERWLIPYAGKPKALASFLENSNLKACFPVESVTAAYGHDNHSFREAYDILGFGHESL